MCWLSSHTGTPLKLKFAKEQKRAGSSGPQFFSGFWVPSSFQHLKSQKIILEFNMKMGNYALSSVQTSDSWLGLQHWEDAVTESQRLMLVDAAEEGDVGRVAVACLAPRWWGWQEWPGMDYTRARDQECSRGE